ncbi:hypothetical protein C0991_005562 [Blastosporella zonata]|nr:hypothetical protein C0991_005562 [Blastosporella zonata]
MGMRGIGSGSGRSGSGEGLWLADVKAISKLLEGVPGLVGGELELGRVFGEVGIIDSNPAQDKDKDKRMDVDVDVSQNTAPPTPAKLRLLEAPHLAMSKSSSIIHVLPPALRFWEKLGLGPRGGGKDGTVFVLFEEGPGGGAGAAVSDMVAAWLGDVIVNYEGRHLGKLTPGKIPASSMDGLVPLRFDSSFRMTLTTLISGLPASQSSLVFFIVTPLASMTLSSPTLRHIFSALLKSLKTYSEALLHFQLVPEHLIHSTSLSSSPSLPTFLSAAATTADPTTPTQSLVLSLYNRLLVPVDRTMSRRFFEHGIRVRRYFQEPAFTLARPLRTNRASFVRAAHASLDVMDRGTFVHVGYGLSPCGRWVLAACVDERGEAHELGVWAAQGVGEEEDGDDDDDDRSNGGNGEGEGEGRWEMGVVKKVWEFAMAFAKKAKVEWRIVFSKLGVVGEAELDGTAWMSWIDVHSRRSRIASFTLLSVEPDAPWTFCTTRSHPTKPPAPRSPSLKAHNATRTSSISKGQPQNIFTDISTTIFVTSPYTSLPQSYPPTSMDLGISLSHVPESGTDQPTTSLPHPLPLLPCSTTSLVCIPATLSLTAASMLHLHLLHTVRPQSAMAPPEETATLHAAITQNFHELAVLARTRWRLDVSPILPFHLAAVEAMRIALGRDQYGIDVADGA